MSINELLALHRQAVLDLAAKHGAYNVRLFGSAVRKSANSSSDIDVLVNLEKGRSFLDLCALGDDLEDLLERKVDLLTEPAISPHLRNRILKEAIPLSKMTGSTWSISERRSRTGSRANVAATAS